MHRLLRLSLFVIVGFQAVLALGFILQWPPITRIWPLPYTNDTAYIFIGSIAAAAVASTLWGLLTRQDGALAGVFLDYVGIFIPVAIFTWQIGTNSAAVRNFSLISLAVVIYGLVMLFWSVRIPIRDPQPTPRPLLWAFGFFVIALIIAGGSMVLKLPSVLPWDVNVSGQVIYGWMFLGAAVYFAYGTIRPSWQNAGGQLAGFLAYDLVLIVPLLLMLPSVRPEKMPNLIIYIGVLIVSGGLAIFYLFINPATRIRLRAAA